MTSRHDGYRESPFPERVKSRATPHRRRTEDDRGSRDSRGRDRSYETRVGHESRDRGRREYERTHERDSQRPHRSEEARGGATCNHRGQPERSRDERDYDKYRPSRSTKRSSSTASSKGSYVRAFVVPVDKPGFAPHTERWVWQPYSSSKKAVVDPPRPRDLVSERRGSDPLSSRGRRRRSRSRSRSRSHNRHEATHPVERTRSYSLDPISPAPASGRGRQREPRTGHPQRSCTRDPITSRFVDLFDRGSPDERNRGVWDQPIQIPERRHVSKVREDSLAYLNKSLPPPPRYKDETSARELKSEGRPVTYIYFPPEIEAEQSDGPSPPPHRPHDKTHDRKRYPSASRGRASEATVTSATRRSSTSQVDDDRGTRYRRARQDDKHVVRDDRKRDVDEASRHRR